MRVLISHILADVTETILKESKLHRACFAHTGCLIEFTRSDNDNLIKSQGVISKIIILLTNTYTLEIDDIANLVPDAQNDLVYSDLVDDYVYQMSKGDILPYVIYIYFR